MRVLKNQGGQKQVMGLLARPPQCNYPFPNCQCLQTRLLGDEQPRPKLQPRDAVPWKLCVAEPSDASADKNLHLTGMALCRRGPL